MYYRDRPGQQTGQPRLRKAPAPHQPPEPHNTWPAPPESAARDGPAYTPGDDRSPPGTGTLRLNPAALTGTGGGKELAFELEPLAGPCDHRHEAAGHDPGARLKHLTAQSPGWRLEQAGQRGWFRWTTPSGRTYLTRPTQCPGGRAIAWKNLVSTAMLGQ
jgi:hypothetical protein